MKFFYLLALLLLGFSSLASVSAKADDLSGDSIIWKAEVGTSLGGGEHNPLWLSANKFGFSSTRRNNVWLRLSAKKEVDKDARFSWGAGMDMGLAARFESAFMPQQLYGEVKYRSLWAMLGAKEISDPLLNHELSSGALTAGWNARPIPQLRVGIFEWADVWGCKEMLAVKGHIAYGFFDDNWWIKRWVNPDTRYTLSTLYCSRELAFRFGNARKFPLSGELGMIMETEFGGRTWIPDGSGSGKWDHHPTYAKAWLKALIPMKGGADTNSGEQSNVEGNMLGNWHFALSWQDSHGWSLKAYYQHYFEDHSMMTFDYPWKDGLYGVEAHFPANRVVSALVCEYLTMKDQSGPVYWDHTLQIDYQVSGRDGYYNHYIYNPWQHWGQGIATPLITAPLYNANHQLYFASTRVQAWHIGLSGNPCSELSWRFLASHIRSWGTYELPFTHVKANFSALAELKYHPRSLNGWEASVGFALDHGSLIGNSTGVSVAISKTGMFKL